MKRIEEQTYYEILEVSPNATAKEIQRAYEHAKETFSQDSPAGYSLFQEQDITKIQSSIEEAYRVLMDELLRKEYDQSHPFVQSDKEQKDPSRPLPFSEISIDLGVETFRGKTLKQIRERIGIDLKTVSEQTKINTRILEWIEEEAIEKLPPLVYVKGFLKVYAKSLGLDPQKVIGDYLTLFTEKKKK